MTEMTMRRQPWVAGVGLVIAITLAACSRSTSLPAVATSDPAPVTVATVAAGDVAGTVRGRRRGAGAGRLLR